MGRPKGGTNKNHSKEEKLSLVPSMIKWTDTKPI